MQNSDFNSDFNSNVFEYSLQNSGDFNSNVDVPLQNPGDFVELVQDLQDPNSIFALKLDNKPFENPLDNPCFMYYLIHINQSYDYTKLCNDHKYLQTAYDEFLDHLYVEQCRPNFLPEINVEDYVLGFDHKNKNKNVVRKNGGNSYIIYRRYLMKYLEKVGMEITDMKEVSPLAGKLWNSEPKFVKDHYRKIMDEIKKRYNSRLVEVINNNAA